MAERVIDSNGIRIWTEDFGDRGNPTLLLIMGASAQGIQWPVPFIHEFVARKYYVIRYDNRDTGQSTCFDFAKTPYTLDDLADDAVGVLDAYDIGSAHVAGSSCRRRSPVAATTARRYSAQPISKARIRNGSPNWSRCSNRCRRTRRPISSRCASRCSRSSPARCRSTPPASATSRRAKSRAQATLQRRRITAARPPATITQDVDSDTRRARYRGSDPAVSARQSARRRDSGCEARDIRPHGSRPTGAGVAATRRRDARGHAARVRRWR
jgi:pimeloyl-ACP methyl ester carboxylesterase